MDCTKQILQREEVLEILIDLIPQQRQSFQDFPVVSPNTPESLLNFIAFFEGKFFKYWFKNGYDSIKHSIAFIFLRLDLSSL
jgi:hypothetical protein